MKNITAKAEELVEEKKHAASLLLEKQVCFIMFKYSHLCYADTTEFK